MPPRPKRPELSYRTASVRAASMAADAEDTFAGHAARWWSIDAYGTALKPGAFRKTLKERGERVPVLWQHDPLSPIGRPTELAEDKEGLAFRAQVVTDTQAGAEALALLRADVPLGMSFGFETLRSRPIEEADAEKLDWSQAPAFFKTKEGRDYVRVVEEVRLWEISLVTFPANDGATVDDVRADDGLVYDLPLGILKSTLSDIRDGALSDERAAVVAEIVAAWGDGAAAGEQNGPSAQLDHRTPAEARPDDPFVLLAALESERLRLTLAEMRA